MGEQQFWHGGPRGLKGWILPSSETGVACTADYGAGKVCRRDRVYLTTNRTAAEMFGCMAPSKKVSVYLVEPVGELEKDEDCRDDALSVQATKARILKEFPMTPSMRMQMLIAVARP